MAVGGIQGYGMMLQESWRMLREEAKTEPRGSFGGDG
jgi:hypothetical protein